MTKTMARGSGPPVLLPLGGDGRTGSPVWTRCAIGSGDGFSIDGSASAASGEVSERRFHLAADSTPRRGDRRSWAEIWKQSSPRRGEGTPLHGRSKSWAGDPGLNSIGTRRGPRIEGHVASEDSKRNRALGRQRSGSKSKDPDPSKDEGAIVEFFGQLWLVPEDRSPRISKSPRVRPGEGEGGRLVWIAREKWRNRDFEPDECFPVGDRDWWIEQPRRSSILRSRSGGRGRRRPSFKQSNPWRVGGEEGRGLDHGSQR
jgi:hypothetical protein